DRRRRVGRRPRPRRRPSAPRGEDAARRRRARRGRRGRRPAGREPRAGARPPRRGRGRPRAGGAPHRAPAVEQGHRATGPRAPVRSAAIGRRRGRRCAALGRDLEVMVQVNVWGEGTKSGGGPDDAPALAAEVAALPRLRLVGFMTIGLNAPDAGRVRAGYARLREVRDAVVRAIPAARELAMGMSGDLELAVAEGATIVRVGTAVFGARPAPRGGTPG